MTNRTTAAYVAGCAADGSGLRTAGLVADFSSVLSDKVARRVLPRPLFVDDAEIRRFADDAVRVFDLITSLPARLFDGDLRAYCAALRIPESWYPLLTRLGGGPPPLYARADMYHDGGSFQLLEFNIESNLGGLDRTGEIPRKFLEVDAFARFAAEHRLSHTHTGKRVAALLRELGAEVAEGREPTVVLLDGPGGLAEDGGESHSIGELMRRCGLDFHVGELDEVSERGRHLFFRSRRIDVVLRDFSAHQLAVDPVARRCAELVFRKHEDREIVLWTPLESTLYSNKGCLAMLSDPRFRSAFTPGELALIDRVVPWTRAIGQDAAPEVLDECREHKDEILLKPNSLFGGAGIVAGWESDDRTWAEALRTAPRQGYVAQRRVVPDREPVVDPVSGEVEDWEATWGLYLTPGGYTGVSARVSPIGAGAVISMTANARTRAAGVFTT